MTLECRQTLKPSGRTGATIWTTQAVSGVRHPILMRFCLSKEVRSVFCVVACYIVGAVVSFQIISIF